ncbi:putative exported protein [Caenispirillum salinarum AK4]|uniref:Putative exported protein n=1 Tax=Caenispirillum salinarum AK4 TaxID=1238182 RepID=K9GXH2_9PROT|nr:DUF1513 domain-containing protein [Caenispirillum salinarum]EKV29479.1 putative exported protein [Caenispirillum salinarum AK4]
MPLSRRSLLTAGAVGAAGMMTAALPLRRLSAAEDRGLYLSANTGRDGGHRFSAFTADGTVVMDIAVPDRAHGCTLHPDGDTVAVFARRPGRFVVIASVAENRVLRTIDSVPGRHFYGHGTFSADGGLLYVTENAYDEEAAGIIGVYDATDGFRRIGEMNSGGIGPHDMRLMPDGRTLVVANGGIRTHPDMARVKLNLDTMDPSLTYLDASDGRVLEQARQPEALNLNSMRHLAVTPQGRVLCVQQWQGPADRTPPLVAMHERGADLSLLAAPDAVQGRMRNYCGSATVDPSGSIAAVSAPRGGLVTFWDLEAKGFLGSTDVADGCGVAPAPKGAGFVITSGAGGAWRWESGGAAALPAMPDDRRWDNHLTLRG